MKIIFNISFSIIMLLQSVNFHFEDVINVKYFFEHVQLHKQKHGDNFFTFISKHYGELKESHKEQHQEEEKDHKHTPIHHDCAAQTHIDVLFSAFSFSFKTTKFIESSKATFYYQDKFSTFEKQKIFQPPQFS